MKKRSTIRSRRARRRRWAATALLLTLLLASVLVLRPVLSSVDTYRPQMRALDEKRATVLKLAASSSAASAVITLIPDDVGTPIAEQLADLSAGFVFILTVLLAEKYLLPIIGALTTTVLIPLACGLGLILCLGRRRAWLKNAVVKLAVLCVALLTVIPVSVYVSGSIDATFEASINETIEAALDSDQTLNVGKEQDADLWRRITGAVAGALDYVGRAVDIAKHVLGNYVEAVAVMLVTSCVIPILILFLYILFVRRVFSLDFSAPDAVHRRALPPASE